GPRRARLHRRVRHPALLPAREAAPALVVGLALSRGAGRGIGARRRMRELLADLDRWRRDGEDVALATLLAVHGSAPRLPGARMAITWSGRMAGSVSGGCVESDLCARAMTVLDTGRPAVASYGIDEESAFAAGLSCGGAIDVLIEPFVPTPAWERLRQSLEASEA